MYDSSFYTIVVRARIASDTPSQADRIENGMTGYRKHRNRQAILSGSTDIRAYS